MKVKRELRIKDIEGQSNLESFILKIYDVIQSIPESDRANATINIDAGESYGEPFVKSFVNYTTDETPEEIQKREQMDKFKADLFKEKRRLMFEELKKEFGDE